METGVVGKLHIVGIGPGNRDYILPEALEAIERSQVIIGGKRNLELFDHLGKEKRMIGNNLEEICSYISGNVASKAIAVLASGDPGVFGILEFLKRNLPGVELDVIPGISSFQYLCSKLKISWHDVKIISLHGREQENLAETIKAAGKVAVFTGGKSSPGSICRELVQRGLKGITVTVGENLSYEGERIIAGTPEEIAEMSFASLSILLVEYKREDTDREEVWNYSTGGIPDPLFVRGQVPMTKEEVRTVTLSKLRLKEGCTVYDIGAGTGSVSIECGLKCPGGTVYAIEKEREALELIHKNIHKFKVDNVSVVEGTAPEALKDLPEPDRVFIGGTGGNMEVLLDSIREFKKPVRVVVNAVALESAYEAISGMEAKGYRDVEIVCVSVSRGKTAGTKHLMQALNPVYIISGEWLGGDSHQREKD